MKYAIAVAAIASVAVAAPADWEPMSTTTSKAADPTTWASWTTTTSKAADPTTWATWADYTSSTTAKCSTTSVYSTKTCGYDPTKWEECKYVTSTTTLYPSVCPTTTSKAVEPVTWSAYPVSVTKCPATTSYYTTKVCGYNTASWEECKYETKTSVYVPTTCPTSTWAAYTVSTTPVAPASTWATYAPSTPVAAASSSWANYGSSTYAAPVAKYTGAADKSTFGMGAIAIAAVAALL